MEFQELAQWGGYLGMACVTALYFFFPARRKELDNATQELISTLQETVNALKDDLDITKKNLGDTKKEVETLREHQEKNIEEIKKIKLDRDSLREILEARDKNTQIFQEQILKSVSSALETNQMVRETLGIIKSHDISLAENNRMTKEFVETMQKHLLNVEHAALKTNK